MEFKYKHIVVVHGIGDQAPNETALNFMNEFIRALPQDGNRKLSMHNLIESVDHLTAPDSPGRKRSFQPANIVYSDSKSGIVNVIGFSEVYWQPITNSYIKENEGNLPIPIFTWARTLVNRLSTPGRDFTQWRLAIENLERILRLLKILAVIFKKIGVFNTVAEKLLGDVQMYAESDQIRQEVNQKFFRVVSRIREFADTSAHNIRKNVEQRQHLVQGVSQEFSNALRSSDPLLSNFTGFESFNENKIQIYVIAHSEGAVVSYNSLVWAAMAREGVVLHADDDEFARAESAYQATREMVNRFDWFPKVAGLVTLGSPLDKHFMIWPNRFRKHLLKGDYEHKIAWQNYTDKNDPVGYPLREALKRDIKSLPTDAERLFCTQNEDHIFQRYPIPGKAHVDYWADRAIHERIIRLMGLCADEPQPLKDACWARFGFMPVADWAIYFTVRTLLLGAGLYFVNRLLHTGISNWLPGTGLSAIRAAIPPFPFGNAALPNELFWFATLTLLMNPLIEFEKGYSYKFTWSQWPRYFLNILWLAVALVVCLDWINEPADSGINNLTGYITGLAVVVLLWKLHTCVHRGLIQLWRYTRAL